MQRVVAVLVMSWVVAAPATAQTFTRIDAGEIATRAAPANGASWVDIDNDNDIDLFIASPGPNLLYRNDGNDTFTRITEGELTNLSSFSIGNSFADIDNDGDLDVFVANGGSRIGSLMYRNDGSGNFTRSELWGPGGYLGWAAAWGDYDNDGFVDLFVVHPFGFLGTPATGNLLLRNNGDNSFSQMLAVPMVQATGPYTVPTWSDFDQDGDIDLFIGSGPANGTLAPDFLYLNRLKETGRATFERMTTAPIATDSLDGQVWNWVDYDNDSDLDVYVTNWGGPTGMVNHLYRNDGGTFVRVLDAGPIVTDADVSLGSVWGDYDNDGDLDTFVTNAGPNRYYRNDGNGQFTAVSEGLFVTESFATWGGAAGDYDNDGDLDLYVSNKLRLQQGQAPTPVPGSLFRNDTRNGNHWISLKLIGTSSNRSAIGAKVRATASIGGRSVTQLREVSAQNNFGGQNDLRVHFGLADAVRIDRLVIEWPSGQVDTLTNVAADGFHAVTEGGKIEAVAGVN